MFFKVATRKPIEETNVIDFTPSFHDFKPLDNEDENIYS
jgi:hypothetical protein